MNIISTALQRMRAWLRPGNSPQLGRTAMQKQHSSPGTRERAILHAIRVLYDNAYGVTIQEELERAKIDLSFGAINDCLAWLVQNEFVEWHVGSARPDGRGNTVRRKLFTLTPKGEEALRAG